MDKNYDIIIVGAGLIGSSMILALKNQGLSIAVLERNIPTAFSDSTASSRPIALAHGSKIILDTLGVWSSLSADAGPITRVHVSEQQRLGHVLFSAEQQGVAALGYVVPFANLYQVIYQNMTRQANVQLIAITEILHLHCDESQVEIKFKTNEGEQKLIAKLLIAAEGRHSACRQLLNISTRRQEHDAWAVTAIIQLDRPHANTAYERFSAAGTLAILPLMQSDRCRLVWTMSPQVKETIAIYSNEELLKHVQKEFGRRLGKILTLQRTGEFPLKTILSNEQIRDGFVLIGDAAHTFYPIAAQGFNLGLGDVAALAEVLVDAQREGEKIGSFNVLSNYINWRRRDQNSIIRLTTSIVDIFELKLPLVSHIRAGALLALDLLGPLKARLGRRMMGHSGRLPKLARGIKL